eukprot:gene6954-4920_t
MASHVEGRLLRKSIPLSRE